MHLNFFLAEHRHQVARAALKSGRLLYYIHHLFVLLFPYIVIPITL